MFEKPLISSVFIRASNPVGNVRIPAALFFRSSDSSSIPPFTMRNISTKSSLLPVKRTLQRPVEEISFGNDKRSNEHKHFFQS